MQHHLVAAAKNLRRQLTPHEIKLWRLLRDRQCGDQKFRRQVPIGPFIADFCCLEKKLVVELDGGGHADPKASTDDQRRDEYFRNQGFSVLRFWNNEVDDNLESVYEQIFETLLNHPSPRQGRASPTRGEASGLV
ncbi:MAG: endonuclease domain-containing protein [bacterium]|nr:endonuclease domain-containing protein [bacterium]